MQAMQISALLFAASLCAASVPLVAQTKPPSNSPEVLFVQTAKKVAFKDGTLTLEDVSPATAFFSDRP